MATTHSRFSPADPVACPFPHLLLTERFGFSGIPLTDEETSRCKPTRVHLDALAGPQLEQLVVELSPVAVALPEGVRPAYMVSALRHVALQLGGFHIHIEAIEQRLSGPGGTNREVRVYVDGLLVGRSIALGRLCGNANSFPVAACIGREYVLTAAPRSWLTLDALTLTLHERSGDVVL
jgi:hypothetical protein